MAALCSSPLKAQQSISCTGQAWRGSLTRSTSSSWSMTTKPKPLDSPVRGFLTMRASRTLPYFPNLRSRSCTAVVGFRYWAPGPAQRWWEVTVALQVLQSSGGDQVLLQRNAKQPDRTHCSRGAHTGPHNMNFVRRQIIFRRRNTSARQPGIWGRGGRDRCQRLPASRSAAASLADVAVGDVAKRHKVHGAYCNKTRQATSSLHRPAYMLQAAA